MNIFISSFLYPFIISIALFIICIPIFRIKCQQSIRELAPKNHQVKSGTPTMGGLIIVIAVFICYTLIHFLYLKSDASLWFIIVMPLITFFSIGFIDDFLIVYRHNNKGISPNTKMAFQIIWAAIYFYIYTRSGLSTIINTFGWRIELKWFYGILVLLMLVSTSNAVNLTDGLDGLAGGTVLVMLIGAAVLAYSKSQEVFIFILVMIGAILGFLCYNFHPAKIFMGDVGSLAIGASLANIFILLKMEILLVVFGFVIVVEALSDIIQVWYFKKTHGKRVFKMAPLHHHFELSGLSEVKINILFWLVGIMFCILGIVLGKIFY